MSADAKVLLHGWRSFRHDSSPGLPAPACLQVTNSSRKTAIAAIVDGPGYGVVLLKMQSSSLTQRRR